MVARTKSKIACFAAPSFHEGNRPTNGANCADADRGPSAADIAGSIANVESKTRRLTPEGLSSGFTLAPFTLRDDTLVALDSGFLSFSMASYACHTVCSVSRDLACGRPGGARILRSRSGVRD